MADRIIKPDSGNDVVIQNNGGTRKIEVTNAGDVEVTGDFKATTVKATNLKANDGTASLEIADSTGDIGFSVNTNLKIKLPSSGGIYESDGSTEILTESSGAVKLKNTTLENTVVGGAMSVGTVSGSSTTPTGDIAQIGSNSDGTYWKYANGLLICEKNELSGSSGSATTWTFPHAFSTEPFCFGVSSTDIYRIAHGGQTDSISTTAFVHRGVLIQSPNTISWTGATMNLIAIGKWG